MATTGVEEDSTTMKDALAIHRMLLERETLHEIVRLPRLIANADELPKALGLPAARCLATRVRLVTPSGLLPGGRGARFLAAVVVPAGTQVPADALRAALGVRSVRPAAPDIVNAVTDYAAELVAPLLLPDDVPVFLDQRVVDSLDIDEVVYTATGEPSTALGIRILDLLTICGAKPIELAGLGGVPARRRARSRSR